MDHILLLDAAGKKIVSRLDPGCRERCFEVSSVGVETCRGCNDNTIRRRGKNISPIGTVFVCSNEPDLVASKRVFLRQLAFYSEALSAFQELRDETVKRLQVENRRLIHNLTTLNSHILQEIYAITPQEKLIGGPTAQIQELQTALIRRPDQAARAALRILKNAVAARTEMQIVRRFQPTESTAPLNQKQHVIHRVVTNALITFFQDSQEKNLTWTLSPSIHKVFFDYETTSAAMYRLFENAVKYCKPGTNIKIEFTSLKSAFVMTLSMKSLWIGNDEAERIFDEAYSGRIAKEQKLSGEGLGLYFVREMLRINGASIQFKPSNPSNLQFDGIYGENKFEIGFAPGSSGEGPISEVTRVMPLVNVRARWGSNHSN